MDSTRLDSGLRPGRSLGLADRAPTRSQVWRCILYMCAMAIFTLWDYKIAFTFFNFTICAFYAAAVGYRLLAAMLALLRRPEIAVAPEGLAALRPEALPVYTVLIPMYREAGVVAGLLDAIRSLDYPLDRLDVKLVLEEDDAETISACRKAGLPVSFEIVLVPPGTPRTKPRACNFGLEKARGELLVVFDAEDRPEPDQLKKAVAAFIRLPASVACLQAKLNYHNADQNWLTRFFALEYTAWFDLFLPGLHRMGVPIPLGGTSNHFRTGVLKSLGGWDPWNVAEDCDLGIRLARAGHRTMILDSTTWEEATFKLWNWVRQRSRWIKGYLQTHLVHTRNPLSTLENLGLKGMASFLLTVGGLAATLLLNPIYWLILALWGWFRWKLAYFDFADETQAAYTGWSMISWVFCGLAILLFAANFALIALNLLACARRKLWRLWLYALFSPVYWALISLAAWKGAMQLLWNPFYWEKTEHGSPLAE